MNRETTNLIRFFLDGLIPMALRDNKFFMYPFFYIWYKGKNVSKLMDFKKNLGTMTEEEYAEYYRVADSFATGNRPTDMSQKSIDFTIKQLGNQTEQKILDVGCGSGYFLSILQKEGYTNLMGCDLIDRMQHSDISFQEGEITRLPFADNEFDTVICNHTIEHIMDSNKAVEELKRVCKHKLILTTPRQRYFRYTFDLHVNFYPEKFNLVSLINCKQNNCTLVDGDWTYVGIVSD